MNAALLCLGLMLGAPSPGALTLLAEEAEYKKATGTETWFEGTLERNKGTGQFGGAGRFNVYRLVPLEARPARDLYLAGKGHLLAPHVGKRVRVTGKLIETEIDGKKVVEIWPARLEIGSGTLAATPGADGVYARCDWQPSEAQRVGIRHYVFRDGAALAKAMRLTGTDPETGATTQMARLLRVPEFDWKKHMVVTVCAGLTSPGGTRLAVTRVSLDGETLVIAYRLDPPSPSPGGFGYPAETVLVNRHDGAVRLERDRK